MTDFDAARAAYYNARDAYSVAYVNAVYAGAGDAAADAEMDAAADAYYVAADVYFAAAADRGYRL